MLLKYIRAIFFPRFGLRNSAAESFGLYGVKVTGIAVRVSVVFFVVATYLSGS